MLTRRTNRATLALLTLTGAVVATYGCRDATQVTLAVSTAKVTCGALMGVRITVAGNPKDAEDRAGGDFVTATATCPDPAGQDVGTLVITPGDSGNAAIVIVSSLLVDPRACKPPTYAGCIVARRSLSFRDHVSATIPVVLDPACADVPCDVATTCKQGTCITSQVECNDDGECVSPDPRGRVDEDASVVPFDSGRSDGAADGSNDASPDAGGDARSDAASDSGGDGSTVGCMLTCPYAPGGGTTACNTAAGDLCCYIQGTANAPAHVPAVMCLTRTECTTREPYRGIAACCWSNADCSGKKCCFKRDLSVQPTHPEPKGFTYCADDCMGAEDVCNPTAGDPDIDCLNASSGRNCVAIGSPVGYNGSISGCQP